ncbi:hypothetical protein [Paractinoplanes globisporus]|uniref:Transposase n=1 Tax=Paractinoplanes globisporus TaxID=113565 RepID=A0ABW6W3A4_9ACTN|nr:hypothetical protein [Actinoplanes globisporus]
MNKHCRRPEADRQIPATTADKDAEIARLRAQVAGLQQEKLILRKAAAWIAFYNYPHPANRGITRCPRPGGKLISSVTLGGIRRQIKARQVSSRTT